MTTWFSVIFEGALTHAVPEPLLAPLLHNMETRGVGVSDLSARFSEEYNLLHGGNPAEITKWGFDLGGPAFLEMPESVITLEGIDIHTPCNHYDAVLRAAENLKVRTFESGEQYVKLKLWYHATVLTVDQWTMLLGIMRAEEPLVEKALLEFDLHLSNKGDSE